MLPRTMEKSKNIVSLAYLQKVFRSEWCRQTETSPWKKAVMLTNRLIKRSRAPVFCVVGVVLKRQPLKVADSRLAEGAEYYQLWTIGNLGVSLEDAPSLTISLYKVSEPWEDIGPMPAPSLEGHKKVLKTAKILLSDQLTKTTDDEEIKEGDVIGILSPFTLLSNDGGCGALCTSRFEQVVKLGKATHLAYCKWKEKLTTEVKVQDLTDRLLPSNKHSTLPTRTQSTCGVPIDLRVSSTQLCPYHTQKHSDQLRSKRVELNQRFWADVHTPLTAPPLPDSLSEPGTYQFGGLRLGTAVIKLTAHKIHLSPRKRKAPSTKKPSADHVKRIALDTSIDPRYVQFAFGVKDTPPYNPWKVAKDGKVVGPHESYPR